VVNFPTLHAVVGGVLRAGEHPAGALSDLEGLLGGAVVSDLGEGGTSRMLSQSAVDGVVVWWVVAGRWRKLRPMLSSDGVAANAARSRIVEAGGWRRSKRTQRSKGASTDDERSRSAVVD